MQTKQQSKVKNKGAAKFVAPIEHQEFLSEISGAIAAMGRRTTGQAFDLGIQLALAKEVLPEKSFGKWVKQECGLTTRQAWNYVALPTNLSDHRARLEDAGVVPTVMFVLASADAAKVEEAMVVIESGQRLTVAQAKSLTKGETAKPAPAAIGGVMGFRRAAEAKAKAEAEMFGKLTKSVLTALEKAAETIGAGKTVTKAKLAEQVEMDCFKASALLRSAIEPVQSAAKTPVEWEKARQVIGRLGDGPRWPGRTEFPDWVVKQALPALRFVVRGTPISGEAAKSTPAMAEVKPQGGPDHDGRGSQVEQGDLVAVPAENPAVPKPVRRLALVEPSRPPADADVSNDAQPG